MIQTLESICCKKIIDLNVDNLGKKLNNYCYLQVIEKIIEINLKKWKNQMKIVHFELLIEEIDIHYDMFMGDLITIIDIKNKNNNDIYCCYPYFDEPEYSNYLYILEQKGIIDI
jgi:hypothetical protein